LKVLLELMEAMDLARVQIKKLFFGRPVIL
jgi:hypothetical protein